MPVMQQKNNDLEYDFPYLDTVFLSCQFTTLAKYSKHTWSTFGANIGILGS